MRLSAGNHNLYLSSLLMRGHGLSFQSWDITSRHKKIELEMIDDFFTITFPCFFFSLIRGYLSRGISFHDHMLVPEVKANGQVNDSSFKGLTVQPSGNVSMNSVLVSTVNSCIFFPGPVLGLKVLHGCYWRTCSCNNNRNVTARSCLLTALSLAWKRL